MKELIAFCGKLGSGKGYCMTKELEDLKSKGNTIYIISFADQIKRILRNSFGVDKNGVCSYTGIHIHEGYVKHEVLNSIYDILISLEIQKFKNRSKHDVMDYLEENYHKHGKEFFEAFLNARNNIDYTYSFRRLGQLLGTELGRHIYDEIWVEITLKRVDAIFARDLADIAIIDDCRFLNEYDAIKAFGDNSIYKSKIVGVTTDDETRAKRRNMSLSDLYKQDDHASEKEIDLIIKKDDVHIIQN